MEISATALKPAKASRRRKIELIDDVRAREITFVKRREGLFRKASELSVLCGAETAVITFSRTGVPFVFSHPSADVVIGRYTGTAPAASKSTSMISAHSDQTLSAHKQRDAEALDRLNAAKRRRVDVHPDRNADPPSSGFWWEDPSVIQTTEIDELEFYIERMEELRAMVSKKIEEMTKAVIPDFSSSGSSNAGAIVPIFSPNSDEELTQTLLDHEDLWDDLWSDIDHTQSTVESTQLEEDFWDDLWSDIIHTQSDTDHTQSNVESEQQEEESWDDLWSDIDHTQSTVQPEEDFWEGLC